jgi:tripartite-type tricarboxylate transporter receptor subunit TctC
MQYTRRKMLTKVGAALALLNTGLGARAQDQDNPEGKLVYGFASGSIASLMGDMLLDHLRQEHVARLKMSYMPGNGSRLAQEFVKRAPPDGGTLALVSSTSLTLFSQLYGKRLNYEVKDFTPIAPLYAFTRMLIVGTAVPASVKTVDDYMKWVQLNPTQSHIGVSAIGSGSHFAAMMLAQSRDTVLRPVTYRGTGAALKDMVSGNLPAAFVLTDQNTQLLESGQIRVLGVTSEGRWPTWPDVPTLKEQGVADCALSEWHGVLGPVNMDPAKVHALNLGIRRALRQDNMVAAARKVGLKLIDVDPAQFSDMVAKDVEQWRKAVSVTRFHGLE